MRHKGQTDDHHRLVCIECDETLGVRFDEILYLLKDSETLVVLKNKKIVQLKRNYTDLIYIFVITYLRS
jgi:hypothetical protein